MTTTAVIGTQWGDEGKGKIVDHLAQSADVIVRFGGGANAGHTLVANGVKHTLHLLPSGILHPKRINVVGPGVLCDPEEIAKELKIAIANGSRVMLDWDAPVVLPLHKQIDAVREKLAGKSAIGTTKRGIGPCMEDLVARRGLKIWDLVGTKQEIEQALLARGFYAERSEFLARHGETPLSLAELVVWCGAFQNLHEYIGDTRQLLHQARAKGKNLLFEGAQGMMLGLHCGFPYCTSSDPGIGGIGTTLGIHSLDCVIGVAKAYLTRVGYGPFPTKLTDEVGERLREVGNEYGSTTGRPRDTGWLDLPLLKYACQMGGITKLMLTKLDVLTGLKTLKVCTAYDHVDSEFCTLNVRALQNAIPIYEDLPGWTEDITACRNFNDLPRRARQYVEEIERYLGLRIFCVGVGPDRSAVIWRD